MIIDFEYATKISTELRNREQHWRDIGEQHKNEADFCRARADGLAEARRTVDLMILADKTVTS